MVYNSPLWTGASKNTLDFVGRSRTLKLTGNNRVASSISSLVHRRNVSYFVLYYKYYFGKCSSSLYELIPQPQVFPRNTRLSGGCHAFTVATMSHLTTHYRENSFCTHTARLWNNLLADIFSASFNISLFKATVSLSAPSI